MGFTLGGQAQVNNLPEAEILMLQGINQLPLVDQGRINSNSIYIEQVGSYNKAYTDIKAVSSKVNLIQDGSQNGIALMISAKSFSGNITQNGNFNRVFDFVDAPSEDISLNLIQNGKEQHFERHGSNSIGDNLSFKMDKDYSSIIVRNFK